MSAAPDHHWEPTASIEHLRRRAAILSSIRDFFAARQVMEVDTQILSHCAVSDPFIDSIEANFNLIGSDQMQSLYLQTSPEFAMKRLLAAGAGSIYQLGKVFRNGEVSPRHNPEFTMLEWYRIGFDHWQLMNEVEALVLSVLPDLTIRRISYRDLFLNHLDIDPHQASVAQLSRLCRAHIDAPFEDDDPDTWRNLLMSHLIEPALEEGVFVYGFPASQAALARVERDETGIEVATRFELFVDGLELANGYYELTDAAEQARRLAADQQQRERLQLPQRPTEQRLVAALQQGLPECAGVALGVDRLVMLALGASDIAQVIPFAFNRA
ncbi:EF-P lysine aminoacylase EpmA [Nitrincola alkalilacustris]|uniref:EF-P lysine aminoacylase EpmA n=1 Tax=Nitrincola alkalilacustris TaxID=1571224 RepID=UPI00124E3E5E|nr:EF-P lysine aminoacylase EpmA [Nitrincola alkalilacustris]